MKNLFITVAATLALASGCATHSTNYSVGNEFSSENISMIIKSQTTKDELVNFFGQPQIKSVLSESDEKWVYSYVKGTASAESMLLTTKVNSTGVQKMLDVLIRNGVVINYAYTETSLPTYKNY